MPGAGNPERLCAGAGVVVLVEDVVDGELAALAIAAPPIAAPPIAAPTASLDLSFLMSLSLRLCEEEPRCWRSSVRTPREPREIYVRTPLRANRACNGASYRSQSGGSN